MTEVERTTIRELERDLSQLNDEGGKLVLLVDADTDFQSLINAIRRDTKDSPPFPSTTWRIEWCDGDEYTDWTSLMNLIRAMGRHHLATKLEVDLPFQRGHLAKLATSLRSDDASLEGFQINDMDLEGSAAISGEEAEKEIVEFFAQICLWKEDLIELEMTTRFILDPILLERMAELLPSLNLEQLSMEFNEPPQYDLASHQKYNERMTQAYKKLQNGLEPNHSLQQMGLWVHSDYNSPLNTLLSKLFDENLEFLLSLNASGRGDIITMPLHRDTWLEIIARYTDDDLDGEYDPDAVYYYLRRNTWMFTPDQCLEREIKTLQDELRSCKKRHREEMDAKDKQHQQEIEDKDLEIERLRAALAANNKGKRRKS